MPSTVFSPLTIGNVEVGSPVVQAALSGYSDWPMRVLARRHGASYVLCEVMLDQFLVTLRERKRTSHFLHNTSEESPVAGQLMGAEPDQFAEGAVKLVEAGFDVIDINFGCPGKKVLGRCRGGFHLSQPDVALEIIRRTREVVPDSIPVTVKMRRGIDDSEESRDHFFEILEGAFEAGLAAATIHGRTVKQRYVGPSRWEFLKEVKQTVGLSRDDGANGCGRSHGSTRSDRQSLDFPTGARAHGGGTFTGTTHSLDAAGGDKRALSFGRIALR